MANMAGTTEVIVGERALETTATQRGPESESLEAACRAVESTLLEEYNLLERESAELVTVSDGVLIFAIPYGDGLLDDITTRAAATHATTEFVADSCKYVFQEYATHELSIDDGVFATAHCIVTRSPDLSECLDAGLSETQARVFQLMEAGFSIKETATMLDISTGTVKSHRNRVRQKVSRARRLIKLVD
jgi:transposase-like protein